MKIIFIQILYLTAGLVFVFGHEYVTVCTVTCEPNDEFVNGTSTEEWDDFMDTLLIVTSSPFERRCKNSSELVIINKDDDFIWDLRFQIYNRRNDQTGKTLNDCYCEYQGDQCKSEDFRECLKSARLAMTTELGTWYPSMVYDELERRAEKC